MRDLGLLISREIGIGRGLSHVRLLHIHEVWASEHRLYLIQDHISNFLLTFARQRPFSENMARIIFRQIVDGVKFCHKNGVFFRCLRAANIFLTRDNLVKIAGFEWAYIKGHKYNKSLSSCSVDTMAHCSPEIVEEPNSDLNLAKADAWSLGVILYQLLYGEHPFLSSSPMQTKQCIAECTVHFPPTVSAEALDLLSKLIIKNPKDRLGLRDLQRHAWYQEKLQTAKYILDTPYQSPTASCSDIGVPSASMEGAVATEVTARQPVKGYGFLSAIIADTAKFSSELIDDWKPLKISQKAEIRQDCINEKLDQIIDINGLADEDKSPWDSALTKHAAKAIKRVDLPPLRRNKDREDANGMKFMHSALLDSQRNLSRYRQTSQSSSLSDDTMSQYDQDTPVSHPAMVQKTFSENGPIQSTEKPVESCSKPRRSTIQKKARLKLSQNSFLPEFKSNITLRDSPNLASNSEEEHIALANSSHRPGSPHSSGGELIDSRAVPCSATYKNSENWAQEKAAHLWNLVSNLSSARDSLFERLSSLRSEFNAFRASLIPEEIGLEDYTQVLMEFLSIVEVRIQDMAHVNEDRHDINMSDKAILNFPGKEEKSIAFSVPCNSLDPVSWRPGHNECENQVKQGELDRFFSTSCTHNSLSQTSTYSNKHVLNAQTEHSLPHCKESSESNYQEQNLISGKEVRIPLSEHPVPQKSSKVLSMRPLENEKAPRSLSETDFSLENHSCSEPRRTILSTSSTRSDSRTYHMEPQIDPSWSLEQNETSFSGDRAVEGTGRIQYIRRREAKDIIGVVEKSKDKKSYELERPRIISDPSNIQTRIDISDPVQTAEPSNVSRVASFVENRPILYYGRQRKNFVSKGLRQMMKTISRRESVPSRTQLRFYSALPLMTIVQKLNEVAINLGGLTIVKRSTQRKLKCSFDIGEGRRVSAVVEVVDEGGYNLILFRRSKNDYAEASDEELSALYRKMRDQFLETTM